MSNQPAHRFAVVTGAAGGIGRAIVREFNAAGYEVIATDRVPKPPDLPCSLYLHADLARTVDDEGYAAELFARIRDHLAGHGLAALINNAAVQILGGADSLTRADWRQTLDVNLLAPFLWTQALLPELEQVQGCVVNISSIHARLTKQNFVAYATSKAALSAMTRAMAVDVGARIRINAIEPAAIETDMLKAGFASQPHLLENLKLSHPIARIGKPSEVARLVVQLAHPENGFTHGACVMLDGGVGSRLNDPN
jgi:NAD(P)-dependent dehydrogenase (short-subunit alcohol dehydrogenase family)